MAGPSAAEGTLRKPRPQQPFRNLFVFMKRIDTILWGRKTYTKAIEMGMKDRGFGPKIKNYLFSRQPQRSLLPGFELVKEPIKPFAQRLRAQPGKNIWMMGGGEIITSFLTKESSTNSASMSFRSSSANAYL